MGGVYQVLKQNELNRLPKNERKRARPMVKLYEKQFPRYHQVDVKFLYLQYPRGKKIRRFQYTAIDAATRIRTLKLYVRHTQQNAIDFVDHAIDKFPFRIHRIQTDNGHEFQNRFHRHLLDLGLHHRYINPRTPKHNGKLE